MPDFIPPWLRNSLPVALLVLVLAACGAGQTTTGPASPPVPVGTAAGADQSVDLDAPPSAATVAAADRIPNDVEFDDGPVACNGGVKIDWMTVPEGFTVETGKSAVEGDVACLRAGHELHLLHFRSDGMVKKVLVGPMPLTGTTTSTVDGVDYTSGHYRVYHTLDDLLTRINSVVTSIEIHEADAQGARDLAALPREFHRDQMPDGIVVVTGSKGA